MTGQVTKSLRLKSVGVSPEVHGELKELQQTTYGEISMNWVIRVLLDRNEGKMINPRVEKEKR